MIAWPHQTAAYDWSVEKFQAGERGLMLALPMGVGKSKIAIDLICKHIAHHPGEPVRILILCPDEVVGVWPREFRKHATCAVDLAVLRGDTTQKRLQAEYQFQSHPSSAIILVCNYDAAWRNSLGEWLLKQHWNFVVGDESHKFKAVPTYKKKSWQDGSQWVVTNGKLAAFMSDLSRVASFRLCLTGTPMAHSPQDIFSQVRFLDRGQRFGNSGYKFLQRYARFGGYRGHEIIGWTNQAELSRLYNQIAWTCPPDVIELPDAQHETREFDLGREAHRAYGDMWRFLCAQVGEGKITAANGAVAFLRLQQITSGIGRLTDGSVSRIDHGKQLLLQELFDDLDPAEKVVVFCQFQADLQAVKEACEATPGRKCGEISGGSKSGLASDATYSDDYNCLAVQLQAGGVGIDLSAAHYAVYFSPGLSLANYLQSLKRVHRPGQKRPVTFLHFNARNTIDTELYERLEAREDLVKGILALARTEQAA